MDSFFIVTAHLQDSMANTLTAQGLSLAHKRMLCSPAGQTGSVQEVNSTKDRWELAGKYPHFLPLNSEALSTVS